jgi:predicted nucleic acid-binding protein
MLLVIVSGDRDLLDLDAYKAIRVVSPHRLAEILNLWTRQVARSLPA